MSSEREMERAEAGLTREKTDPAPDGGAPPPYLLVCERDGTFRFPLPRAGEVVIGRAEAAELVLRDPLVSRAHARLHTGAGGTRIVDLGSQNGTLVNGERIGAERELLAGDLIQICGAALVLLAPARRPPRSQVHPFDVWRARAEEELARASRSGRALALLVIGLEGSAAAPAATSAHPAVALDGGETASGAPATADEIEAALLAALRPGELAGRGVADDHRLVLLPETGPADAGAWAERLARGVAARLGLACAPRDGCDLDTLYAGARAAARAADRPALGAPGAPAPMLIGGEPVVIVEPAMSCLFERVKRLAIDELPLLLMGEAGTGKALVARVLHHWSRRSAGPWVAFDCAGVPPDRAEAALFGGVEGGVPGEAGARPGLFEAARGGTLFLERVGALSPAAQAKLLGVLQSRRASRLGEGTEREVNVRLVASECTDLAKGSARGELGGRPFPGAALWIPPLGDRRREIVPLAHVFLASAAARLGKHPPELDDSALAHLQTRPWPGNLGELRSVLERALHACDGATLGVEHLGGARGGEPPPLARRAAAKIAAPGSFRPIDQEIAELERDRMRAALAAASGNQRRAAELISMPLRTFVTKLKVYGLRPGLRRSR